MSEKTPSDIKVGYQEHTLDEVLKYFADGFKPVPGVTLVNWEAFVDATRNKVIFKLSMCKDTPDKIITLQ